MYEKKVSEKLCLMFQVNSRLLLVEHYKLLILLQPVCFLLV